MIQHQVHRLVVADGERIVGLLEQLDLLSYLSNHSYLITVQIVQARDLDGAARRGGAHHRAWSRCCTAAARASSQIGRLVQALNAKLFERTWQLVAPAELLADELPVRDGQRRAWRAAAEDRPGQRPDPARRRRASTTPRWPRPASASRRRCATSATPTARAASWSANPRGGAAQRDFAATVRQLAAAARPRRPDGAGDLHRRACGGRRRRAAGARARRGRRPGVGRRRAARPLRRGDRLVPRRDRRLVEPAAADRRAGHARRST